MREQFTSEENDAVLCLLSVRSNRKRPLHTDNAKGSVGVRVGDSANAVTTPSNNLCSSAGGPAIVTASARKKRKPSIKKKMTCQCGAFILVRTEWKHKQSNKHIRFILRMSQLEAQQTQLKEVDSFIPALRPPLQPQRELQRERREMSSNTEMDSLRNQILQQPLNLHVAQRRAHPQLARIMPQSLPVSLLTQRIHGSRTYGYQQQPQILPQQTDFLSSDPAVRLLPQQPPLGQNANNITHSGFPMPIGRSPPRHPAELKAPPKFLPQQSIDWSGSFWQPTLQQQQPSWLSVQMGFFDRDHSAPGQPLHPAALEPSQTLPPQQQQQQQQRPIQVFDNASEPFSWKWKAVGRSWPRQEQLQQQQQANYGVSDCTGSFWQAMHNVIHPQQQQQRMRIGFFDRDHSASLSNFPIGI